MPIGIDWIEFAVYPSPLTVASIDDREAISDFCIRAAASLVRPAPTCHVIEFRVPSAEFGEQMKRCAPLVQTRLALEVQHILAEFVRHFFDIKVIRHLARLCGRPKIASIQSSERTNTVCRVHRRTLNSSM